MRKPFQNMTKCVKIKNSDFKSLHNIEELESSGILIRNQLDRRFDSARRLHTKSKGQLTHPTSFFLGKSRTVPVAIFCAWGSDSILLDSCVGVRGDTRYSPKHRSNRLFNLFEDLFLVLHIAGSNGPRNLDRDSK